MGDRKLERLFRRFATRGDAGALGEVFDQVAPELLRLARHLVGHANEAEDLVQSTFLTAIERAPEFEDERRLVPWLIGILARHAANARRKRQHETLDPSRHEEALGSAADATRVAEGRELGTALARTVEDLPSSYRAVLRPHLIEGKSAAELARELGLTPGAVRVRLHRGLKLLRRALPAGFAAGTAFALEPSRGLAAVRSIVLANGRVAPLATAGAGVPALSPTAWLGGVLVTQRIVASAVVLVAVTLSILFWRGNESASRAPLPESAPLAEPESEPSRTFDERVTESAVAELTESEREVVVPLEGVLFHGRVLDDASGAPIAGARAWSTPAGASERILRARSNDEGRIEFRASAEEELTLEFDADGYALRAVPLTPERRTDFWSSTGREVRDGGARIAIDEVRLKPGVDFMGRVVRTSDRSAVAGAELVLCWWSTYRLFTLSDRVVGRTLEDGSMSFDGRLPARDSSADGHYVLFALHGDGIGWTRVPHANGRAELEGIEILLGPGTRVDVVVQGPDDACLPNARVRCLPLHDPFASVSDHATFSLLPAAPALAAFFEGTTDEGGLARFEHLPSASVQLAGNLACRYEVAVEIDGRLAYRRVHGLDCEEASSILVRLEPDARTWITGSVRDAHGALVDGASVRAEGLGREVATDAEGRYRLERLPEDPVYMELRARAPGFSEARRRLDFDMRWPKLDGHDFVLCAPLSISGRVVDDESNALADVRVWAYGPDEQIAGTGPESVTGEDGAFVIPDASEGEWQLWPIFGDSFEHYEPLDQGFPVRGGDSGVLVTLQRRKTHEGRLQIDVLDIETGAVLDPVHGQLFPAPGSAARRFSQPELLPGQVVFTGLAPGRYDVWVAVAGRANGHGIFEIGDDLAPVRGEVRIGRTGEIRGKVEFASVPRPEGCQASGVLRTVSTVIPGDAPLKAGGAMYFDTHLEPDGSFASSDLVPGTWSLCVRGEGLRSEEVQLELASGGLGEAKLVAELASVIELVPEPPPESGWIVLLTQKEGEGEEAWSIPKRIWSTQWGPLPPLTMTVDPGRLRWRVLFLEKPNVVTARPIAEPQEGELELAAGERRRIPLRL